MSVHHVFEFLLFFKKVSVCTVMLVTIGVFWMDGCAMEPYLVLISGPHTCCNGYLGNIINVDLL